METQNIPNSIPAANTPVEESIFHEVVDTARFEKNLKNARIWLYVIAGMQTIMGIYEYNTIFDKELAMVVALIDVGLGLLFFVLALWSNKQPFAAFTTALVLYIAITVASVVLNPASLSIFFLIKLLVVIAFVKAIGSAREISKLKESMGEI